MAKDGVTDYTSHARSRSHLQIFPTARGSNGIKIAGQGIGPAFAWSEPRQKNDASANYQKYISPNPPGLEPTSLRASGPADAITQWSVFFPEQPAHPVQSLTDAQVATFIKTSEQLKSRERW